MRRSLQDFAHSRFHGEEIDGEDAFTNLRRNVVYRVGLFILGALPSLIKIYSTDGILQENIWCTAYIVAFFVDEILLFFAPPSYQAVSRSRVTWGLGTPLSKIGPRTRAAFAWVFYIYIDSLLARSLTKTLLASEHDIDARPYWPYVYIIWLFAPSLGVLLLLCMPGQPFQAYLCIIQILYTVVFTCSYQLVLPLVSIELEHDTTGIVGIAVHVLGGAYALYGLAILMEELDMASDPEEAKDSNIKYGTYFVSMHLCVVAVYCGTLYDPSITSRPAWTSWLG